MEVLEERGLVGRGANTPSREPIKGAAAATGEVENGDR